MNNEQEAKAWDAIFSSVKWRLSVIEDQLEDSKNILKRLERAEFLENSSLLLEKDKKTS